MKKVGSKISPHLSRCTHIPTLPDHITLRCLQFKIDDYNSDIEVPKRLKLRIGLRIFERKHLLLFKDGNCYLAWDKNHKHCTLNTARIIRELRAVKYKTNELSDEDWDFIKENCPDGNYLQWILHKLEETILEIAQFLRFQTGKNVRLARVEVLHVEFCQNFPLTPHSEEFSERVKQTVTQKFGYTEYRPPNDSDTSKLDLQFLIEKTPLKDEYGWDCRNINLKYYTKQWSNRLEQRFTSVSMDLPSDDLVSTIKKLCLIGSMADSELTRIINAANESIVCVVDVAQILEVLEKRYGSKKVRCYRDWIYFIRDICSEKRYCSTSYNDIEAMSDEILNDLCKAGFLEKLKKEKFKSQSHKNIYKLRDDWQLADFNKIPSKNKDRSQYTPRQIKAIEDAAKIKGVEEWIWSNSLWKVPDENDELIQLLKSKSA